MISSRLRASSRRCALATLACLTLTAALTATGFPAGAAPPDLSGTDPGAAQVRSATRIVSINPSLTAILLALGARDRLVGVDEYSARQQQAAASLPRVGGLHDVSLEALVALRPDLVVLVPSVQHRGLLAGLGELEIPYQVFDPYSFDEVLQTIEALGARVDRRRAAGERVAAIRLARERLRAARASRPRLRGVLVLTRDPLFLAGTGTFIDEMLETLGIENLAGELSGTYPRASLEWLVAARPELIIDAVGTGTGMDPQDFWSRWPSLPAVQNQRVVSIPQGVATLPGPYLDQGLEVLAHAVDAVWPAKRP